MALFLNVLANNVLPAFLVIALGFLLDRAVKPDLPSISRMTLNVLSPCLVFTSLTTSNLAGGQISTIAGFAAASILGMTVVSLLTARLMRLDQPTSSGFVMATTMVNCGNFGLSVVLFAYGEEGLEMAIIYFVTSAVLANTVGAFIASRSQGSWHESLRNVLRLPMVYAAIIALCMRLFAYVPPNAILRPLSSVGQAAVPVMLLMLGMQLSRTHLRKNTSLVLFASTYKLIGMSLLAFALASLFGLTGLSKQVCILEASTPTAVTASLLAVEFRARPDVVASVIFVSTLASAVTITTLIAILA